MRPLLILIVLALLGFLFFRQKQAASQPPQVQMPTAAEAATPANSDFLKRPIDRAQEALNANRKRVSDEP